MCFFPWSASFSDLLRSAMTACCFSLVLDNEQPNGNESHKGNVYGITNADDSTDHRFQYEIAVMCDFNCRIRATVVDMLR